MSNKIVYLHKNNRMKRFPLVLFFLLFTFAVNAGQTYLYRVHVGSFKREDTPKNIREVPALKKYILPEGYYCFFSGGYYYYFEGALRQMKEVQALGFKNATIRVFKNEKLLDVFDGLDLIEEQAINPTPIPANQKVDRQIFSLSSKPTLKNRAELYREIIMPQLTDTTGRAEKEKGALPELSVDWKLRLKKLSLYWGGNKSKSDDAPADQDSKSQPEDSQERNLAKEDVEEKNEEADTDTPDDKTRVAGAAAKADRKEDAEEETANVTEESSEKSDESGQQQEEEDEVDEALLAAIEEGMAEEVAEDIIEENDEKLQLSDDYVPTEKPVFKIYLTSSAKGGRVPMNIKYVPDIVYTYEKAELTLFTVGYYESSAEAQADLARYINDGFYNARIIGLYKTIVVSQKIADEILTRALNAK